MSDFKERFRLVVEYGYENHGGPDATIRIEDVRDALDELSALRTLTETQARELAEAKAKIAELEKCVGGELDVDGYVDAKGIRYLGTAKRQPDGKWICLADVGGRLCRVEVTITFEGAKAAALAAEKT